MSKKITIKITQSQLTAIIGITDELSASLGAAENDAEREKWVRLIDRMLIANGYCRKHK